MTAPVRIQRHRVKGWRMPENTVCVTRPGPFGNPFDLRRAEHCWTALAHGFRADRAGRVATPGTSRPMPLRLWDLPRGQSIERIKAELRGRNLACWCRLDQPCHADVLLEIANG